MENKDLIISDLWNNKTNVLFHVINSSDVVEVLENGFTRTDRFPFILVQSQFDSLFSFINENSSVVLIAIPDDLYMRVFDMEEDDFYEWKSQFDYVYDEYELLSSSDVGSFCMWQSCGDYIENFIPTSLVYATLSLNEKGEVIYQKNDRYYDNLSKSQKLRLSKLLKKAYYEYDMPYNTYEKLVRKIR